MKQLHVFGKVWRQNILTFSETSIGVPSKIFGGACPLYQTRNNIMKKYYSIMGVRNLTRMSKMVAGR
jgi:hypothetical protein